MYLLGYVDMYYIMYQYNIVIYTMHFVLYIIELVIYMCIIK